MRRSATDPALASDHRRINGPPMASPSSPGSTGQSIARKRQVRGHRCQPVDRLGRLCGRCSPTMVRWLGNRRPRCASWPNRSARPRSPTSIRPTHRRVPPPVRSCARRSRQRGVVCVRSSTAWTDAEMRTLGRDDRTGEGPGRADTRRRRCCATATTARSSTPASSSPMSSAPSSVTFRSAATASAPASSRRSTPTTRTSSGPRPRPCSTRCELPSGPGGDTCFIDMRAAFRLLAPELQASLLGRRAGHSYNNRGAFPPRVSAEGPFEQLVDVAHPIVRAHPVTGAPALYFDLDRATHVEGHAGGRRSRAAAVAAGSRRDARAEIRARMAAERRAHLGQRVGAAQGQRRLPASASRAGSGGT